MVTRPAQTTSTNKTGTGTGRATTTTPRSPGKSPTRRATSVTPRSPGRSPNRSANGGTRSSSASQKSAQQQATEHTFTKAVSWAVLIVGALLFTSSLFGGKWGPISIGLLVLASAFPPMRRSVDRMLVGEVYGDQADTVAILRIVAGIIIVLFVLIFL